MATNNTPTVLGSLEFTEIKKNLSDYLKNQAIFSGYNFEGTAIQTIIDLLAYNTFYYAYYANMINAEAFIDSAQKEDSMISLTKPLGYAVPSRTAAKARIQVSGLLTDIPVGSRFVGINTNGIEFNFYAIDRNEPINESGITDIFYIYEGTEYVNRVDFLPTFDYENQRIAIADTNFDLSTLKVYVTETIEDQIIVTNEWTRVGNVGYVSQVDENIYFVERTSTGFLIQFSIGNEIGRPIDDRITKIEVSYLKTNGSAGNSILNFRNTNPTLGGNVIVQTVQMSKGGTDKPNLDFIRALAPKWFSSQERAVTTNDYKALLIESGFFNNETEFNVFGGQDLTPPRYGRVFISSFLQSTDETVSEMIDFIKDRSVITVLPEYVDATVLNIFTDFNFSVDSENTSADRAYILSTIKTIFRNKYAQFGKYNASFSANEFITDLQTNTDYDSRIRNITIFPEDFSIYVYETLTPGTEFTRNFQNEFDLQIGRYVDIFEQNFALPNNILQQYSLPLGTVGNLRMFVTGFSQKLENINLQLWTASEDTSQEFRIPGSYGYFNAYKGVISIPNNILVSPTTLKINFAKKKFKIGLSYLTTFNYKNIEII